MVCMSSARSILSRNHPHTSQGDEETVSALEARVSNFDIAAAWDRHNAICARLHRDESHKPTPTGRLHNRYEGEPGAWQLSESVDAFLARLPPATTDWRPGLDWIWIANPYIPAGAGAALTQFRKGGAERLALLADFEKMAAFTSRAGGGRKPLSVVKTELAQERKETVADLRELAAACNVVTGKWMLFPEPGNVNHVWARVARATANNELGIGAKVETRVDSAKERLICVYTRDFRDRDDVARVLRRMREIELVRPGGRQIYYKSGKISVVDFLRDMAYHDLFRCLD